MYIYLYIHVYIYTWKEGSGNDGPLGAVKSTTVVYHRHRALPRFDALFDRVS